MSISTSSYRSPLQLIFCFSHTLNKTEAVNRLLSSMTSFCRHPEDQVVLSCRLWIGRLSRAESDDKDTNVDSAYRCCLSYSGDLLFNCLSAGCDQFKAIHPDPLRSDEFPGLLKKRLQEGTLGDVQSRFSRDTHKYAPGGKQNPNRLRNIQPAKRWNSRLCMETRCKQSALDTWSYVTCGMQFCNGV